MPLVWLKYLGVTHKRARTHCCSADRAVERWCSIANAIALVEMSGHHTHTALHTAPQPHSSVLLSCASHSQIISTTQSVPELFGTFTHTTASRLRLTLYTPSVSSLQHHFLDAQNEFYLRQRLTCCDLPPPPSFCTTPLLLTYFTSPALHCSLLPAPTCTLHYTSATRKHTHPPTHTHTPDPRLTQPG